MTTQATSSIFPRCISFAHSLPRQPSKLDVVVVRKQQDQYHRDVLLYKTLSSGCWKTTSTIEQTPWQRCASAVTREWWDEWADITSVEELPSEDLSQPSQEYLHSSHLPSSFVPNPALQQTEQETVHQCSSVPEFTTEGYFSMAFPTLFLTGAAVFLLHTAMKSLLEITSNICWCMKTVDLPNTFHGGCCFLAPHCNEVTIGNYFNYILMYEDSRFTKHFFSRFRFFALTRTRGDYDIEVQGPRYLCHLPGSGRRFKLTPEVLAMIKYRMRTDDETTATQLVKMVNAAGYNMSTSTIIWARKILSWTFHGSRYCQMIRTQNKEREYCGTREPAQQVRNYRLDWWIYDSIRKPPNTFL